MLSCDWVWLNVFPVSDLTGTSPSFHVNIYKIYFSNAWWSSSLHPQASALWQTANPDLTVKIKKIACDSVAKTQDLQGNLKAERFGNKAVSLYTGWELLLSSLPGFEFIVIITC